MPMHISGELECKCGAVKNLGEDFLLPPPPFEIRCDECGALLFYSEKIIDEDEKEETEEKT